MFFVQNVILAVVDLLAIVLNLYFWVVIVAAVLSWVRPDPYNPVVRALRTLTEPVFYRVRKWLPFTYTNGIDFSPVVVLLVIQLINRIVIASLAQFAATLVEQRFVVTGAMPGAEHLTLEISYGSA